MVSNTLQNFKNLGMEPNSTCKGMWLWVLDEEKTI